MGDDFNPADVLSIIPGIGSVAANLIGNSQNVKLAREQREHDLRRKILINRLRMQDVNTT